jgi:hypothetical protein
MFGRRLGGFALPMLGVVVFASHAGRQITPAVAKLEKVNLKRHVLKRQELAGLKETELKQLRGIIFGRHGRVFGEKVIQDFLVSRPWYKPDKKYTVEILNSVERRNMDSIKLAEFKLHKQIEPGDMKFYRDKPYTEAQLGKHTPIEWRLMRAEMEAIHGKFFDGEPWLRKFFSDRYWYKGNEGYSPKLLSSIERKNMATMIAAEKKQRNVGVFPGEMVKFRDKLLTPRLLNGLTLHELRLLRNEVYALHSHRFGSSWLDMYFYEYANNAEGERASETKPTELSYIDNRNVATILDAEGRLRQTVEQRPLEEADLYGFLAEDAAMLRLEILARHGKVFKSHILDKEFRRYSWYKPDPAFSMETLSETERGNIEFLTEFEKKAERAAESQAA